LYRDNLFTPLQQMLFLAALLSLASATSVTTDDDYYCDLGLAATPWWFMTFVGEATDAEGPLAGLSPPSDQLTELIAMEPDYMTFASPAGMAYWNVDTDEHKAMHNPPMRHCEVHYKCMQWVGWEYDFTPSPKPHNTYGQTLGDNAFFTPMSAQGLACAYYHCAQAFYDVSDDGIKFYEMFLPYLMGESDNGKINTNMDFSFDSCHCKDQLAAAYPDQNDADTLVAKVSAAVCINDLSNGGLQSGGWMWFCEKLSCLTAIESKFTDYVTCTYKKYYNVDWEACPTNMQWVMQNYGVGYGGQFVTHLLTIFSLCFISMIPFVLLYGACCGSRGSKAETGI